MFPLTAKATILLFAFGFQAVASPVAASSARDSVPLRRLRRRVPAA
jgi:hypothetical protein